MSESRTPDFSGKTLLVYLESGVPTSGGMVMEFAELQEIGGRMFLVGRSVGSTGERWNIPTWVAWTSIVALMVFDSREDFEANMVEKQGAFGRIKEAFRQ